MREIWVMGSQGDNPQKILAVGENEWLLTAKWSPDARRLAYLRVYRATETYQTSMESSDLKGMNRAVVLPGTDLSIFDFCWLRDGRIVYSLQASSNSNAADLWQVSIDGSSGRPTDKPKWITQWPESNFWRLTASADAKRLAALKTTSAAQIYLSELSAGATRRMNLPRRLTNDEANNVPSAWTADSKAVLFGSDRQGRWGIFKQGIGQGSAEPVVTGPQDTHHARLSADGTWMLYRQQKTAGPSTRVDLLRIPVNGGVPRHVLDMRNDSSYDCARAPATLCMLLEASQDEKELTLTAFDPLKGRGKLLRSIENYPKPFSVAGMGLSPDGTTVAISRDVEPEIRIRLLSLSGGPDRVITLKGWPNLTGLDWSPDGKGLYCGSVSPHSRTILYADLKGSTRVLWQYKGLGRVWGVPSPDGRYLAILGHVMNSNAWMLEGL
jgi:Tol biopolymer transport system component